MTAAEFADLTDSRAADRSAQAHDWVKAGKVFSVSDGAAEARALAFATVQC